MRVVSKGASLMTRLPSFLHRIRQVGLREWVLGLCALVVLLLGILSHTSLDLIVFSEIEAKTLFRFKEAVRPAAIDPRIKIFALDDRAVATLKSLDPPLDFWSTLFRGFERMKVASVTVDKFFDRPDYPDTATARFTNEMQDYSLPLVTIGFATPWEIPLRSVYKSTWKPERPLENPEIRYFYGPNESLRAVFKNVGHALYESEGYIHGVLANPGGEYMPHVSAMIAGISGGAHPQTSRQFVEFISRKRWRERTFSILPAFALARKQAAIPVIAEGDHVIVLPAMYTGNTDWKNSPFGRIEGGYILASTINSALRSQWPLRVTNSAALVALFSALGLLCYRLRPHAAVAVVFTGVTTYLLLTHLIFAFGGLLMPYAIPSSAFVATAFGAIALRLQDLALKETRMKGELETARLVQESFFKAPASSGVQITVHLASMEECCGDWWHQDQLTDGSEVVCLGDATGHGAPAALVTAMAYSAFISACNEARLHGGGADVIVSHMNRILTSTGQAATAMTALIVVINRNEQTIEVANAGHLAPWLIADGNLKTIISRGNPLGFFPDEKYNTVRLPYEKGSRLILMTDGIIERTNKSGKVIGAPRIRNEAKQHLAAPAGDLIQALVRLADNYGQGVPPADDATLMVIDLI